MAIIEREAKNKKDFEDSMKQNFNESSKDQSSKGINTPIIIVNNVYEQWEKVYNLRIESDKNTDSTPSYSLVINNSTSTRSQGDSNNDSTVLLTHQDRVIDRLQPTT